MKRLQIVGVSVALGLLIGVVGVLAAQEKPVTSLAGTSRASDLDPAKFGANANTPDLKAGVTFEFGAIDLSDKPEMLVIARHPFPEGLKFSRHAMNYLGEYQDPKVPSYAGWLYSTTIGANKRFFLVGKDSISAQDKSLRFLVEYDDKGTWLGTFIVHHAAKK